MAQQTGHHQHISDDTDRQNRFSSSHSGSDIPGSLRERAASQPPRGVSDFLSTRNAFQGSGNGGGSGGGGSSWLNAPQSQRLSSPSSIQTLGGLPQSVPTRSASFSASNPNPQLHFASAMRETRTFPSTFEDDETETLVDFQDSYDERFLSSRGRTYTHDPTRSRSQSVATTRPGAIGSGYARPSLAPNWPMDSFSNPLSIPNNRYNELQTPVTGRYGSYGVGRSPQNIYNSSSSTTMAANGYRPTDISNVSPFVRDVGQILLDDSSAFREIWAGMNHHKEDHGGGSGTTSRRHSVSVVQGRRPTIIGFNAPGSDLDEPSHNSFGQSYGGSGLLLTDDDLASDLGSLNLAGSGNDHLNGLSRGTTSQPSSLPVHAPISRAPATDRIPYQQLNMNLPSNAALRHSIGSPVDNNVLPPGSSPLRSQVEREPEDHFSEGFGSSGQPQSQTRYPTGLHQPHARKSDAGLPQTLARAQLNQQTVISTPSPISPTSTRNFPPSSTTPVQQRPLTSDHNGPGTNAGVNDLGRGVPLHAVPSHWHLYIVEFKAGRTDLFYSAELTNEIRVGDLVIVEADRGKDLGKVVNDTITLGEVEAFQKARASKIGGAEEGGSPGGGSGGPKKDINPKKIFGKARSQDIQLLPAKLADEERALDLCRTKARQKKLPMEVIDAEFQWDRRKLTFYFIADKRIDFRELVRELFRVFKTRIWLSALSSSGNYEQ
ncbi:PSP1-domain-containing protein [Thelephora ganbajun]|uniref:PSP1-domain-containing protein n=1 Tax=Thelephora ganbajun TaxID=370292 RepID=A0ACB6ZXA2_THEGA|nr:PSP1-domain-containing protein [Thelephora ganbajun]